MYFDTRKYLQIYLQYNFVKFMNVLFKTIVASVFLGNGNKDGLQSKCFSSDPIIFNTLPTGS